MYLYKKIVIIHLLKHIRLDNHYNKLEKKKENLETMTFLINIAINLLVSRLQTTYDQQFLILCHTNLKKKCINTTDTINIKYVVM